MENWWPDRDSADAYLILDDSLQEQTLARSIEMVKLQYSGAEGGLSASASVIVTLCSHQ